MDPDPIKIPGPRVHASDGEDRKADNSPPPPNLPKATFCVCYSSTMALIDFFKRSFKSAAFHTLLTQNQKGVKKEFEFIIQKNAFLDGLICFHGIFYVFSNPYLKIPRNHPLDYSICHVHCTYPCTNAQT